MPDKLRKIDPGVLELACKNGTIFVSNKLQGRIFAEINGTFVHNFLEDLAANPDPVNFNNIGGNSLWPAPEGGDFAYNYPDHGDWQVQSGIMSATTAISLSSSSLTPHSISMEMVSVLVFMS